MIDTNVINQAAQDVATVKGTLAPYLPALAVAAGWLGREIRNLNDWLSRVAAFVIGHGGALLLLKKLFWNPGVPPAATPQSAITTPHSL